MKSKETRDSSGASFASIFEDLEQIVEQLEVGDLALEQALALFERGVHLCREGHKRLDRAERTIEELLSVEEEPQEAPSESPKAKGKKR